MTQPDDFHERIAEAVHGLSVEAPIGVLNGRDSRAVADAVIRELGLHREVSLGWRDGGPNDIAEYRYVTDWTADERNH